MDDKNWIRLNVILRFIMMGILILIALEIAWNKYGYINPDDVKMNYDLGTNFTKQVTCRQALYYYAEHEWGIFNSKSPQMNLSNFDNLLKENMNTTQAEQR